MLDFETNFMRKFITFNKQINIYLNHFPNSEKFALSQSIRVDMYKVFDLIVEGQKRYYKKTTLTDLDISFERLKAKLLLAYHLGYFAFKEGKTDEKNPTTIIVIKKDNNFNQNNSYFACPFNKTEIIKDEKENLYFGVDSKLIYPIIKGIPCLRKDNGILATKYEL